MFDLTFNIPTLLTAGLAIVAFIVWLVRLESRVAVAQDEAKENGLKVDAAHALVLLNEKQFHAYQLEAAGKFMTQAAVAEIKRDVLSELNRIEARLEAQIDRLLEQH